MKRRGRHEVTASRGPRQARSHWQAPCRGEFPGTRSRRVAVGSRGSGCVTTLCDNCTWQRTRYRSRAERAVGKRRTDEDRRRRRPSSCRPSGAEAVELFGSLSGTRPTHKRALARLNSVDTSVWSLAFRRDSAAPSGGVRLPERLRASRGVPPGWCCRSSRRLRRGQDAIIGDWVSLP
jgi:hypothetical protein